MPDAEVMVVGGGLAGGAVATLLAQRGRSVTLLERTRGPHDKVCGEFLSAEALQSLALLGVDAVALGARPITTLRFTYRRGTTEMPLPFPAMSLTRRVLDEALLTRAAQAGATVCRGVSVESLSEDGSGKWVATTAAGKCHDAPAAFLATGKHDLRGHGRPVQSVMPRHNDLIAFKLYFHLQQKQVDQLQSAVEIYLFRGGYCGLQLVEDGTANLGLLVRRPSFTTWPVLLETICDEVPMLAARLRDAEPKLPKPLALSHIPYGYRRPVTHEGLWVIGDQAAGIPSFSGDGMSIALHSGVLAARMFLEGRSAPEFQKRLHRQLRTPITLATLTSRALVDAPLLAAALQRVPALTRTIALRTRVPLNG